MSPTPKILFLRGKVLLRAGFWRGYFGFHWENEVGLLVEVLAFTESNLDPGQVGGHFEVILLNAPFSKK